VVTVGSNVNGSYALACDTTDGRAAWYKFIGAGRRLKVSTCTGNTHFVTLLSVLSSTDGTCGDDKLTCMSTSNSGCSSPNTGSVVTIDAAAGTTYYASVIGVAGVVGDFGLMIFDDTVGCEEDKEPKSIDGTVTVGSNVNGSYVLSCDRVNYGRGAWSKFSGNGRRLKVSTCTANTGFSTVLSVLSSTDGTCGDDKLTCMGASHSGCPTSYTGSVVTIDSDVETTYYASVIGVTGAVGNFGLMMFDYGVGCEEDKVAQPVDGVVTVGSNVNGSYVLSCDGVNYGRGAWSKFIGTGRRLAVSTCTGNTRFATVLSVLSSTDGTCGDDKLTCISASYSGCSSPNTGSVVTIDAAAGTTYYASVIGVAGAVGDFGLTIFDDTVGCEEDTEPKSVDGTVTVGSNVNGSYVLSCDGKSYGRGAWCKFIGTGRPLTVSTCTGNTTGFATVLSVLSSTDGTCGDDKLTCMGSASGSAPAYSSGCTTPNTGSIVNIDSVANTAYYVSVIGYGGAVGDFGLLIFDYIPSNRRTLRGMPRPPLL
jgi:hypothetical protein